MSEHSQFFPISRGASVEPHGRQHGLGLRQAVNAVPTFGGHVPLRRHSTVANLGTSAVYRAFVHLYSKPRSDFALVPVADKANTGEFLPSTGTSLYATVDEEVAILGDFVARGGAPSSQVYQLELSDPPGAIGVGTGTLQISYAIKNHSGANWTIVHRLKEGASTRHTHTITGTGDAEATVSDTITAPEVVTIAAGTPANLFLEVTATVPGAAQTLRPIDDSTLVAGSWRPTTGTDLFAMIDESSPSTTDYIYSKAMRPGESDQCEVLLTAGQNPWATSGRSVDFTYMATEAGCTLKVELVNLETVVESVTLTSLATTWTAYNWALAQPLTDYSDLRLRFTASYPTAVAATAFQNARPTSTGPTFQWAFSGAATYHQAVNESSPSDSEIIYTPPAGVPSYNIEFPLDVLVDPLTTADHKLRLRTLWNGAFGSTDANYEIRDDGSVIASGNVSFPAGAFATQVITLTGLPSLGFSYGNLTLYLQASDDGLQVSWAQLSVPAERRVRIAHAQMNAASLARVEIRWQQVRLPRGTTESIGDAQQRYAGTRTALYEIASGAWTDISKGGGYATAAPSPAGWDFCSAGPHVIATNWTDNVQWRQDGTAALFADLITSVEKPKARFCCMARNFLLLGDIRNPGSVSFPGGGDWVWWSSPFDLRNFQPPTAGPYPNLLQVNSVPGQVMGLVGAPDGALIFKRLGVVQLLYQGGAQLWAQRPASVSVGTPLPGSIVVYDDEVFWWGGNCFYRMSLHGGEPRRIALEMGAMLGDSQYSQLGFSEAFPMEIVDELAMMQAAVDHSTGTIWWTYRDRDGHQWRNNRLLIYNPREDRWGYGYGGGFGGEFVGGQPLTDDLQIQAICSAPPTVGVDNNKLFRGVEGVRDRKWLSDGLPAKNFESYWFTFGSESILPVTYETQAFTIEELAQDGMDFEVSGVTPIFAIEPPDSEWPTVTVTLRMARDPTFKLAASADAQNQANEYGRYPNRGVGRWCKVEITFAALAAGSQNYGFEGFWLHYRPVGGRS
jgi:hypothetical protein